MNEPGLISGDRTSFIVVKFNNAILGALGDINNANTDWDNNWRFIFDADRDTPLSFTDSNSSGDVASLDFSLALQVNPTTVPDTYSGIVTFELISGL